MFAINSRMHRLGRAVPIFVAALLLSPIAASAQAPSGFTPNGDVRQVGLSTDEGIIAARLEASRARQIRVTVHVLSVDDSTRQSMYEGIGVDKLKTRGSKIPEASEQQPINTPASYLHSQRRIGSTSHVTTSVLDRQGFTDVLQRIATSRDSKVLRKPSMILLDGRQAGYSDITQRPFIIDVERMEGGVSPVIQVLEEGTRIQVAASLTDWIADGPQRIRLSSEITAHSIVGIETQHIFGIEQEATPLQVPTYAVKTATAAEEVLEGEVLLVDPYLTHTVEIERTSDSLAEKMLPYVSRSLRNAEPTRVKRNIVFLLQPSL